MVAVSTNIALAQSFGIDTNNIFGFWDWVGGRYSVCSAVGILPLALQYGYDICNEFLNGCHDMDLHFFEAPLRLLFSL
jgi:glucose-6-phosphate isomerase